MSALPKDEKPYKLFISHRRSEIENNPELFGTSKLLSSTVDMLLELGKRGWVAFAPEMGQAGMKGFLSEEPTPIIQRPGLESASFTEPPSSALSVGVFDEPTDAPRIHVVSGIAGDVVKRLLASPEQMYGLTPQQFEELVMDRIAAMGYEVQQVGNTNQGDGGVDIVFRPRSKSGIAFLGAVQVKHHGKPHLKSDVQVIREMESVLARHRTVFNLGMVVTNTSFTSEAEWYVKPLKLFIRARDGKDVLKWIEGDFTSEREHYEMPDSIQLTSKLILELNHKRLKQ